MKHILDTDIKFLTGVGEVRAGLLNKELGIYTFRDMIHTYPFRYIDRSKVYNISEIVPGTAYIQIRGTVTGISMAGTGRSQRLSIILKDSTGSIELVFFKGIKWVKDKISQGKEYFVFGKPTQFRDTVNMVHPEIDSVDQRLATPLSKSLTGVYSSTDKLRNGGITNKLFSRLQSSLLEKIDGKIEETLPAQIIRKYNLCPLPFALKNIHFPDDTASLEAARFRLKFEELFFLQLSLLKQKCIRGRLSSGILLPKVGKAFNACYKALPFPLTGAQKRVIKEIREDMISGHQMNRLLQGDVGSGKTMVALLSALLAVDNGYQACIMAPTEVLALQHFKNISRNLEGTGVSVALLTGSSRKKERDAIDAALSDGSLNIIVGTHALIEERVRIPKLGLVIIDEQHRFGVEQRARLRYKSDFAPHILVMTATPIPRTLAMTLYGDLDVSIIDEMPPGRKPVMTMHITESKRDSLYAFIKKEIAMGHQAFIVYPLIKESETMDYKNLEEGFQQIINEFPAPKYSVAVVHGQQKNQDKAYDMDLFASGKADILVATSVIEVGVDVPNASVMVIESAERFGLSQLHQLRGRVGRGAEKSYCILMTGYKLSKESRRRIELMCATTDGFELAEEDMKMRGPGDIDGTRQSGIAFDLKISNLSKDNLILNMARDAAASILELDPLMESPETKRLIEHLNTLRLNNGEIISDYSEIS